MTEAERSAAERAIHTVFRLESPKLIARLTRMVKDVGRAEDMAQDALVAALESWPAAGIPENPGAWLMTTAKNRALDELRRKKLHERKHAEIGREAEADEADSTSLLEEKIDDPVGDDLLRLVFVSCHPLLSTEARVAMTLRLVGGLTTEEISRAFLVPEPTIQQRVVRAKRTLAEAKVPFEVPRGEELEERLASVLEVVYLIFNEGYAATAGEDWMRPELTADALRLGRILAELAPNEPEVHGLVALMEIQASRANARTDARGVPILLLDQDRGRWDRLAIQRGLTSLDRALALRQEPRGSYVLQASIAACHARARVASETDWSRIAANYAELHALTESPVVELNRAVAVGMAEGPAAGLAVLDAIASHPQLAGYHLVPSVRADFLAKLGRNEQARKELERAASMTKNTRERDVLLDRAAKLT